MINHKEIEQGTIEWHEIKYRKIGGTLASGLFIKSDTLLHDLVGQYLEDFEPSEESFKNEDMDRGNDLEPFARKYISRYANVEFLETGWLQCEENKLLGISPDGLTEDEITGCEIKCLSRKAHTNLLITKKIDKEKLCQIIHYFTVNPKLKKLYFIAFRPESIKPFIQEFTRESKIDLGFTFEKEIEQIGKLGKPIKPKIVKEPDLKTITQWVEIAKTEAQKIEKEIEEIINNLNF